MNNQTSWTIFSDNEKAWQSILEACKGAKKSIVLEQFIFMADDFGQRLIDICRQKARQGVDIRFLWDAAGSFSLRGSTLAQELAKDGIKLLFWRTLIPGYFDIPNFRFWFFRNHRRTLVIDDEIGYTGSICIHDGYKNWRDTNVRISGPVVSEMKQAFEDMWQRAQKKRPFWLKRSNSRNEYRYVTNYPAPGRRFVYSEVIKAIRKARKNVYITTPYFVPTHRLLRTIRSAARRGADVRIILPENSNVFAIDLCAQSYFSTLLKAGARIFLYTGNVIHGKTITVDDTWATAGSMNLDSVSLLYNFEANIVTTNDDFARELKKHFIRDLNESREIKLSEWQERSVLQKVLERLVHVIKRFL